MDEQTAEPAGRAIAREWASALADALIGRHDLRCGDPVPALSADEVSMIVAAPDGALATLRVSAAPDADGLTDEATCERVEATLRDLGRPLRVWLAPGAPARGVPAWTAMSTQNRLIWEASPTFDLAAGFPPLGVGRPARLGVPIPDDAELEPGLWVPHPEGVPAIVVFCGHRFAVDARCDADGVRVTWTARPVSTPGAVAVFDAVITDRGRATALAVEPRGAVWTDDGTQVAHAEWVTDGTRAGLRLRSPDETVILE